MPQEAGRAFCRCAMTCSASDFAAAFYGAIYISRYYLSLKKHEGLNDKTKKNQSFVVR